MDVDEQVRRWESIANHIPGKARLEHTAHSPARRREHGYVVTAMRDDNSARKGKSRQVVFGPMDVSLDEFLSALEAEYLEETHPLFR